MSAVDCETSEEYFYDSEQSLASEASGDSFHSANEEFFLPYNVRTDGCEVSTSNLVNKLFKAFFLAILFELFGGSSKHKRNMLRQ